MFFLRNIFYSTKLEIEVRARGGVNQRDLQRHVGAVRRLRGSVACQNAHNWERASEKFLDALFSDGSSQ